MKKLRFRPTSSLVKEALFNIVGPLDGQKVLDLFGGSGFVAFEALDLGAKKAVIVEKDRETFTEMVKRTNLRENSNSFELYRQCALVAMRVLSKKGKKFDLIYIDPPYDSPIYENVMQSQYLPLLVEEKGIVVVEHSSKIEVECYVAESFEILKRKRYGGTLLTFLKRKDINKNG